MSTDVPGHRPSFVVIVTFICHRGCSFVFVVHCGLLHRRWRRGSCFWCEKGAGQGGVMVLTSTLSVVRIHHVLLLLVHCQLPHRRFRCGPCFLSEK